MIRSELEFLTKEERRICRLDHAIPANFLTKRSCGVLSTSHTQQGRHMGGEIGSQAFVFDKSHFPQIAQKSQK